MYFPINFFVLNVLLLLVCQTFGRMFEFQPGHQLVRFKRDHHGVTGPVHTFVKTDKHANFKWGVRHHVGHHYAG